jgi:sialidase-1
MKYTAALILGILTILLRPDGAEAAEKLDVESTKAIEPEDQTAQGLDQPPHYEEQFVFKGSITEKVPYRAYRGPSIMRAPNGNLVVMAEGRVDGPDGSRIDIVSKVSLDNGKTWGAERVIINGPYNTYGDPTQLVDRQTGRVWVFFSAMPDCSPTNMVPTNPNRYHLTSMISDDNGLTYHSYHEYNDIMPPDSSDAFGRVGTSHGIQVRYGPTKGRLVVLSHQRLVYSDNHGQAWFAIKNVRGTGEGNILDCSNGDFVKNDRPVRPGGRLQSLSIDQMKTWSPWETNPDLPDANCQGTLIRYTSEASGRIRWAFLNAPLTRNSHTLRLSYDEGKTWPFSRELKPASPRPITTRNDIPSAGYSSMTHTADNMIGILIEQNGNGGARCLMFVKVNVPWIMNGNKEPQS